MDPKENSPTPDDSPLTVSTEELERLLQRAESLVADIADGVGLGEDERNPKELHASPFPDKPDALAALEDAAGHVDRIEEQAGAPSDELEGQSEADSPGSDESIAEDDQDLTSGDDEAVEKAEPVSKSQGGGDQADGVAPSSDSKSDSKKPADDRSAASSEKKPAPSAAKTATPTNKESDSNTAVESTEEAQGKLKFAAIRRTVGRAKDVVFAPIKLFIWVLVLLDKPFAGVRPTIKLVLGLAGLVSLLMGIAALFLPKLLSSNPYETIAPYAG